MPTFAASSDSLAVTGVSCDDQPTLVSSVVSDQCSDLYYCHCYCVLQSAVDKFHARCRFAFGFSLSPRISRDCVGVPTAIISGRSRGVIAAVFPAFVFVRPCRLRCVSLYVESCRNALFRASHVLH